MKWNDHSNLANTHALFSPSKPGWEKYDKSTLEERYFTSYAPAIGTALHEEAYWHIKKRIRVKPGSKGTIRLGLYKNPDIPDEVVDALDFDMIFKNFMIYTNDAIGYRMDPEVILYSSDMCYGTTDAISYENGYLRIHDLKTGRAPAHMEQLYKYAALFCLEYNVAPHTLTGAEFRIYQNNDILVCNPTAEEIKQYCNTIVEINKLNLDILKRRSQYE